MPDEYEIIRHPHLDHFNLFLVSIDYRTPHLHRDFEIDLIIAGEATFVCRGKTHRLAPGDVVLMNPDMLHEIRTKNGPSTILSLQVSPRFFKAAVPDIETLFFDTSLPFKDISVAEHASIRQGLLDLALVYVEKKPYFELECMSMLTGLMYRFLRELPHHHVAPESHREAKKRAERIRHIIDYVDEHYTGKIRLQDIALQEGLSLNYLSLFVKENLNMTFQEYVGSLRLNQAKKLLLSENSSLLAISIEAGFSDPRYLTKAFLAQEGTTPEAYRKQKRPLTEEGKVHRSPHSSQRYYSEDEMKRLILHAHVVTKPNDAAT